MWAGRSSQRRERRPDVKNPVVAIVRYEKQMESILSHKVGIPVDPSSMEKMDRVPGSYMKKYQGRPEFEETHFTVS